MDNDIIEFRGRRYRYDADFDCFRLDIDPSTLTHSQRWGWIYVVAALALLALIVTLVKSS